MYKFQFGKTFRQRFFFFFFFYYLHLTSDYCCWSSNFRRAPNSLPGEYYLLFIYCLFIVPRAYKVNNSNNAKKERSKKITHFIALRNNNIYFYIFFFSTATFSHQNDLLPSDHESGYVPLANLMSSCSSQDCILFLCFGFHFDHVAYQKR